MLLLASCSQFSKFVGGNETVLGVSSPNVCTVSNRSWVRISFTATGNALTATCNGMDLGGALDTAGNVLLAGTAGLFHHPNATVVTDPLNLPSAVPPSTQARFRNVVITRGCDGPDGGCSSSLPGESCTLSCDIGVPLANATMSSICAPDGTWSLPCT